MDLFSTATPFNASLAVLAALIFLAAALALEVPGLIDKPARIKTTLYTHFAGLLVVALAAGWLAFKLSFSMCQPIPAATINSVVDRLMSTPAAEASK